MTGGENLEKVAAPKKKNFAVLDEIWRKIDDAIIGDAVIEEVVNAASFLEILEKR